MAALRGSLETFPLDLVLALLEDASVTGTLALGASSARGELELTAGRPTAARHGERTGEAAIGEIVSLDAATFEFTPGATGAADLDLDMAALRERVRARRAEDEALRRDIPSDLHTFVLSEHAASGAQLMVTAQHLRILRAIESDRPDVARVAAAARLDRTTTLRNLQQLMREGIIEIRPPLATRPKVAAPPKKKPASAHRAARSRPVAPAASQPEPAAAVPSVEERPAESSANDRLIAPAAEPSVDDRLVALARPAAEAEPEPAPAPPVERPNILIGANEAPPKRPDILIGADEAPPERPDILIGADEPKPVPVASTAAEPELDEDAGPRTSIFVSQYLPQGSTIPIPTPTPVPPKRGGILDLFAGFGKHRADAAPAASDPLYSPRHLSVLLNAMLFGYIGTNASQRSIELREVMARVESEGQRIDPPIPIVDGRVDAPAVEKAGYRAEQAVPYLHAVARGLFDDDLNVQGGDHARKVFLAAVDQTWGAKEKTRRDALRIIGEGPALRGRLTIKRGGSGGPFELEERSYNIGRSSSNDVVLHDPSVSRQHARVFARNGRFLVTDAGSTAGTRVGGAAVKGERVLRSGDAIHLGEVEMLFEQVDAG